MPPVEGMNALGGVFTLGEAVWKGCSTGAFARCNAERLWAKVRPPFGEREASFQGGGALAVKQRRTRLAVNGIDGGFIQPECLGKLMQILRLILAIEINGHE